MSIFLENVDIESLDCYQLHLCVENTSQYMSFHYTCKNADVIGSQLCCVTLILLWSNIYCSTVFVKIQAIYIVPLFSIFSFILLSFILYWLTVYKTKVLVLKAEQASRDSRVTKKDRYEEMRRKKDEEREEQERLLVS